MSGNYHQIQLTKDQGNCLYQLIESTFHERQCAYEEGLLAMSSIISIMDPQDGDKLVNGFLTYLYIGLDSYNQETLCNYAILALGDLVEGNLFSLEQQISTIMTKLTTIIQQARSINLKTMVLNFYAELFNNCQQCFLDYLGNTFNQALEILNFAELEKDQFDEGEFDNLKNSLLDYLYSIIHYAMQNKNYGIANCINENLATVMNFFNALCLDTPKLNEDRAFPLAGAFGDLIQLIKKHFLNYKN